ncbi:MAG: hypothetical protein V2B15_13545 [Bacteroidota bacterium]
MKLPGLVWVLVFLLMFLAFGGIYGGIAMLTDLSGSTLQMESVLSQLPVSNFGLPGFFLITITGVLPIVVSYGLLVKPDWRWAKALSAWSRHHWAWTWAVGIGIILLIWLTVQGMLIGFRWPIQFITLTDGILVLLVAALPNIRRHYHQ